MTNGRSTKWVSFWLADDEAEPVQQPPGLPSTDEPMAYVSATLIAHDRPTGSSNDSLHCSCKLTRHIYRYVGLSPVKPYGALRSKPPEMRTFRPIKEHVRYHLILRPQLSLLVYQMFLRYCEAGGDKDASRLPISVDSLQHAAVEYCIFNNASPACSHDQLVKNHH